MCSDSNILVQEITIPVSLHKFQKNFKFTRKYKLIY